MYVYVWRQRSRICRVLPYFGADAEVGLVRFAKLRSLLLKFLCEKKNERPFLLEKRMP